jgi:alkaline phosphatase
MKKCILIFQLFLNSTVCLAQHYTSSSIFAHNDYVQPLPLQNAYANEVGFIEADVFLIDNALLVAHTRLEINKLKTLEALYLKPLATFADKNKGFIYENHNKDLTLIIDLKTDGERILTALVEKLQMYPQLLACKNFHVAVSGDMPPPDQWKNYPEFIQFDGRPGISCTPDQLTRIALISQNFKQYSRWNGKGEMPKEDQIKLSEVIKSIHAIGKPVRFWAIPDFAGGWEQLMKLNVDVLNTDKVLALSEFLSEQ